MTLEFIAFLFGGAGILLVMYSLFDDEEDK